MTAENSNTVAHTPSIPVAADEMDCGKICERWMFSVRSSEAPPYGTALFSRGRKRLIVVPDTKEAASVRATSPQPTIRLPNSESPTAQTKKAELGTLQQDNTTLN
jgi:hypothetical protein